LKKGSGERKRRIDINFFLPGSLKPEIEKDQVNRMGSQNNTKIEDAVSEKDFLPVVGIGASAGGLEAIENFLGGVPPEPDMALVIIQHLSPDYTSMMDNLVPLFHYSLREGGYLFLGYSETTGSKNDLFSTVNSKYKIYRASKNKGGESPSHLSHLPLPFSESQWQAPALKTQKKADQSIVRDLVRNVIINEYSPPGMLINHDFDILYFSGDTEKYLLPPMGDPSFNFFDMARQGLRHQLNTKIRQAIKEHISITCEDVPVKYGDKIIPTHVEVKPLGEMGQGQNLFLVLFREKDDKNETSVENEDVGEQEEKSSEKIQKLKEELSAVRQYYQSAMEELQVTNEELRASNEELQSTNEELQSTNEEHETAKEELQSTNEELSTVNADLDNKIEELEQAYGDMHNLLVSTEIGTVFLDPDLKIKRFTPAVRKIFNLIPEDIGRPLSDIAAKTPYSNIIRDAQEVLDTLKRKEIKVPTEDGNRFSLRILPYRTTENVIDGVVLTFIDISRLIENEK
jgi:two-component system CheB/CheR fusion protein